MDEIWVPVLGYEKIYKVSSLANIVNVKTNRVMKQSNNIGYFRLRLCNEGVAKQCYVHKIVMTSFNGIRDSSVEIDHIDGDKLNNKLSNLRYISHRENISHGYGMRKNKTSETVGVYKSGNQYRSMIYFNGKSIYLGRHKKQSDASKAYKNKLLEIHKLELSKKQP